MIAWLVETLIASTGLVLLVLVLRNPVRQQFGARAAYALWLLPALRMVMPPLTALVPASSPIANVAHSSGALSQLIRRHMTQLDAAPALAAPGDAGIAWPMVLAGLWLAGALVFALWQVVSYRRFTRAILASARPRRSPAKGINLLASPRISGPMAFGIAKRFIVFPHDALMRFDVEEHAMALAHELAHHRRGDLLANTAALGFLALHWCNPLAWMAHRAFRADQEMACDADVIDAIRDRGLGHAYGRALVKCAVGREFSAICHLTTVDRLKRRLSMLSRKSPSLRRRLAGLALTGSVVLAGLALTASGEGMAAQMGAKVSAALPMAQKLSGMSSAMASVRERDRTAQQQHLAAVDAREEAVQAAEDAAEASIAARAARSAVQAVPVPPSAPAAPQPPAPPVAPKVALGWTPPVPPASPAPPAPPSLDAWRDAPPAPKVETRRYRYNDQGGPNRSGNDIPTRAEIAAQVPIIDVRDGSGCSGNRGFSDTREESVKIDGVQRKKITIKICNKDIRRQARTEALRGLQEARADIAAEEELSSRRRQQILSDLDRQIARMRARRD